jgi:hypothetical protein
MTLTCNSSTGLQISEKEKKNSQSNFNIATILGSEACSVSLNCVCVVFVCFLSFSKLYQFLW